MKQRYRYEFERVIAGRAAMGGFKFDAYREKVLERAAAGWRFVSAVVPPEFMTLGGGRAYVDLVFEVPLEEPTEDSDQRPMGTRPSP